MKELSRMKHLQLRNSLSEKEIAEKSTAIGKKLFSLPEFGKAKNVMFYVNFRSEVATLPLVEKALKLGKAVCVPVTSFKEKKITVSRINSTAELRENEKGIMEPEKCVMCPVEQLEIVIVPGIAFDLDGYRLGYGGGFYDRLLKEAKRGTLAIGLCFEQNIEERLPRQSHDARMNKIVSEERVIEVL